MPWWGSFEVKYFFLMYIDVYYIHISSMTNFGWYSTFATFYATRQWLWPLRNIQPLSSHGWTKDGLVPNHAYLLPALWHVRTRVISKSRGNRIKLDTRYSWTKDIHSTFILRFVVAFWNKYMCAMVLVKLCTWLFTSSSRGIWNQPQTFLFDWDITNNIIVMGTQWIYIYMYT